MSSGVVTIPTGPERPDGSETGSPGPAKPPVPNLIRSLSPAEGRRHELTAAADSQATVALTRDQVMTAAEVADLLHLPVSTVYGLARRGKLPASRFGRTWRFLRPRIEELLRA